MKIETDDQTLAGALVGLARNHKRIVIDGSAYAVTEVRGSSGPTPFTAEIELRHLGPVYKDAAFGAQTDKP